MIRPLECPDDENRENLSAFLKDVSDEKRRKLREKTVGKVLEDVRGMFFAATGVRKEK
jgi:hypothetical protein